LCITAAYGNFLPKKFLAIPKFGTLNIHPSLLPKYRGASPVQRCLENSDAETGVSILYTISKMDAGPILMQKKIALKGHEKSTDVLNELFDIGTKELINLLPSVFNNSVQSIDQVEVNATHALKISANESLIDFQTMSATTIHNKCRAFSDWPGIHCIITVDKKNIFEEIILAKFQK
jgi:methionyl-tRNA formyltransferase